MSTQFFNIQAAAKNATRTAAGPVLVVLRSYPGSDWSMYLFILVLVG